MEKKRVWEVKVTGGKAYTEKGSGRSAPLD